MPETRTYQGHIYTRSAPGQAWQLAGPATGTLVNNPKFPLEVSHLGGANALQASELARQPALNSKASSDAAEAAARAQYTPALLAAQVAKAQADAAASDAGTLDPATKTFYAQQVLAGAPMPSIGMGRQAAAARQEIMAEVARLAGAGGLNGADQARQLAHYKAGSGQIGNLEKMAGSIGVNEQTALANGQQFLDRSAELPGQTRFAPINAISDWVQRRTGGTTISAADAAYNTFVNEYAKVVAGSPSGAGTLSDSARHEAMSTISGNGSLEQKQAAFDQMKADMANRMTAIHSGINDAYKALTERPGYDIPTSTQGLSPQQQSDRREGAVLPGALPPVAGGGGAAQNQPGLTPTGGNQRTFVTQRDEAFANEAQKAFVQGASRQDIDAIAAKYGAQPFGPELDRAIANRANNLGVQFTPHPTGHEETGLTGSIANGMNSGVGAFAAGAGNAAMLGQLGHIAELTGSSQGGTDVAMRMARNTDGGLPYFGGAMAADGGGSILAGGLAGRLAKVVANPTVAAALESPYAGNTAYGAASGAGNSQNPWEGAVLGGVLGAAGTYAGAKLGEKVASLRSPNGVTPLAPGENMLMAAVDQTGRDKVIQALTSAADLKVPASIADVSQEANSLTGAAIRKSPAAAALARDTLIPRGRGQYDRMIQSLSDNLGPVENISQRSEDLIKQAQASASPLYDQFRAAPGAGAVYPSIEPLLARPSMQNAMQRANRLAAEEGRDPTSLGFDLGQNGEVNLTRVPSWDTLDLVKRALDDVVQSNKTANMGRVDNEGRLVNGTLQDFLGKVDAANPLYPQARAAYAGPVQERGFLEAGQNAVSATPDQLATSVQGLSPERMGQMRLGMQSQLAENAGRVRYSTNPYDSVLGTPAMEKRLSTMYGGAQGSDVARLLAQRDLEGQLAGSSNRLIGNSMTAERQGADEAFLTNPMLEGALHAGAAVATGGASIPGTAARLVEVGLRDKIALGLSRGAEQRADQIAPIALDTDPVSAIGRIQSLAQQADQYRVAKALLAQQGQAPGAVVGSAVPAALLSLYGGNEP